MHTTNDAVSIRSFRAAQLFDGLRHWTDGILPQQFQHAYKLPHSGAVAMPFFQPGSQFAKHRRKLPIAVDVGVIQCRRTSGKRRQIMQRIKNLVARFITAFMRGHHLIVIDDVNAIDIALDRDGLEGRRAGNAVTHVVEADKLILIDFRRLADASVEAMLRQSRRLIEVLLQPLANRALRIASGT